jgi:hypothetical protein
VKHPRWELASNGIAQLGVGGITGSDTNRIEFDAKAYQNRVRGQDNYHGS